MFPKRCLSKTESEEYTLKLGTGLILDGKSLKMKLAPFYLYSLLSLKESHISETISENLYNHVLVGDYENAVALSMILEKTNKTIVAEVVNNLLDNNVSNIIEFAFRLWYSGAKEVVESHFPIEFRLLFDEPYLKLVDKKNGLALKLSSIAVELNDRQALGTNESTTTPVNWKMVPIWESNRIYFKIVNVQRSRYLKLAIDDNVGGHRTAWGAEDSDTERHQWYLHPVKYDGQVLFYIYNRQYHEALKFYQDESRFKLFVDPVLLAYKIVDISPEEFGWHILPF